MANIWRIEWRIYRREAKNLCATKAFRRHAFCRRIGRSKV